MITWVKYRGLNGDNREGYVLKWFNNNTALFIEVKKYESTSRDINTKSKRYEAKEPRIVPIGALEIDVDALVESLSD